jgi:uncharacterized membrane protein YdbT with pleckstrin-like domain
MNQKTLKIVSWTALAATIVPSILSFLGLLNLNMVSGIALIGTIVWFVATPLWMDREPEIDDKEVQI